MAVLKDLIVHGPSRFINPAYFTDLKSESLYATNGVFNYLKATTGDIESLSVEDLKAQRATVAVRLDVEGELHTNSWTASNISTIDGAFYITPTVSCDSGTFNYDGSAITVTAASGYSFGIDDLYMGGSTTALTASWWTQYSYVIITGDVLDETNNEWKPLGTIRGRINSASTSSIKINNLTDSKGSSSIITLTDIGTGNKTFRKIKVSLYKRATSSTVDYPIGIYMTALATKGKTFLDIYGGSEQTGLNTTNTIGSVTHSSGALAKPKVRIGNLLGLPKIGGIDPTGWGIYTNNGFFEGTIVATQGKIGGANGWTIAENILYSGSHSTYNASNAGIFLGKVSNDFYVAGGNGAMWYLKSNGDAKIGDMTYINGTLSVPAAKVTGKLTASQIDVDGVISSGSIVVGNDISDMATKTYVGNQGYQTAANVNTIIGNTNVSALNDGSDYTKTSNLANTTAVKNAAKTASNYLGDTDNQTGVTLKAVNGTTTDNTNTSNYIKINGDGLEIYRRGLLVASFGENIRFSSESPQYIGNNNAYIVFSPTENDGQGKITIGGAAINISSQTLEEILNGKTDSETTDSLLVSLEEMQGTIVDLNDETDNLSAEIEKITTPIQINSAQDDPYIKIQVGTTEDGAYTKYEKDRISFHKIVNSEDIEVLYIDSTEEEGVIDINTARIHDSIKIGELEFIEYNGGIAVRRL